MSRNPKVLDPAEEERKKRTVTMVLPVNDARFLAHLAHINWSTPSQIAAGIVSAYIAEQLGLNPAAGCDPLMTMPSSRAAGCDALMSTEPLTPPPASPTPHPERTPLANTDIPDELPGGYARPDERKNDLRPRNRRK